MKRHNLIGDLILLAAAIVLAIRLVELGWL